MAYPQLKWIINKRKKMTWLYAILFALIMFSLVAPVLHHDHAPFKHQMSEAYEQEPTLTPDDLHPEPFPEETITGSTRAPIDEFDLKYILGYGSMIGFLNSIKSADVDSDGTEEVIFGNKEGNIYVVDMSQSEPVTEWISPLLGGSTYGLDLGDVDSDSTIEIVCGSGDGIVRVFGFDGTTYVQEWESPDLGNFAYGLAVDNCDTDEYLEIAIGTGEVSFDYDTDGGWVAGTSFDPIDENLYVFGYDGSSIEQEWSTIVPALYDGTGIYNIAMGDTDADSQNEIVIGTFEWELLTGDFQGRYGIYGFDGSSYGPEWTIRELGNWIMGIGVGNTDGDSDIEIVIAVWDTAFYVYGYFFDPILLEGIYSPEYQSLSLSPFTLALGDIDDDEMAEIVEAEGTEANIFDHDGLSYALIDTLVNGDEQVTGLGIGNTDSIVQDEILVGQDSSLKTWTKQGTSFLTLSEGKGLSSTVSVKAADVNGNGQNELYVLGRTGKISVMEFEGGEFKMKDTITIPSPYSFTNILIDDFDNDGSLEICAIEGNTSIKYSGGWLIRSYGSSSTLYYIEYNGNDYVISGKVAIPDNALFSADCGDFDNDDRIEVVIGGTNGDLVFVEHNGASYVIDDYAYFSDDAIICLDSGDTDADGQLEIAMSNDTGILKVIDHDGSGYNEDFTSSTNFPLALEIGEVDPAPGEEIFVKGGFNFDLSIYKWNGAGYVQSAPLTGYDIVFDEALVVGHLMNKPHLVINSFSSNLLEYNGAYSQIWESKTLGSNAQSSEINNVDSDASTDLSVAFKGNIFIYGTFGALEPVLTISDSTVVVGEQVVFDGSQSTGSGQLDYFFDFGDGTNTGWIKNPLSTHSYLAAGTYQATLRVRDQSGAQSPNVDSKTIFVSAGSQKPSAVIDSVSPNPALEGETVGFAGHGVDSTGIVGWEWRSDISGFLGDKATINISYLMKGNHNITFKVRNIAGYWSDSVQESLRIHAKPRATIDSITPSQPNQGDSVTFSGHGTDDTQIEGYKWRSSANGFLSSAKTFSTSTLSAGAHTIFFSVLDSDGAWSDEVSKNLVVNMYPIALIKSISPREAVIGETIFFSGEGQDDGTIAAYNWESDIDGFLSSKDTFATSGLSPGNHTISFTVKDNKGAWSQPDIMTVNILSIPENIKPRAVIDGVEPAKSREGDQVSFSGHGEDDDGTIKEYLWQSDADGVLSDQRSFFTKDLSAGNHIIKFSVRDDKGAWSEPDEMTIVVEEKEDEGLLSSFDIQKIVNEPQRYSVCILAGILIIIVIIVVIAALWSRRKRRVY